MLVLAALLGREASAAKQRRLRMFEGCKSLLIQPSLAQRGGDFPTLSGHYRGHGVAVEAVPDAVAYRKLPNLWLRVELRAPLPVPGVIDCLARRQGVEFYSPSGDLPLELVPPEGWPSFVALRAGNPACRPLLSALSEHVLEYFSAPQAKELLVTPRGVRLVYQLRQAARAHYLALRSAEFEGIEVPRDLLCQLLDRALAVHDAMLQATGEGSACPA